MSQFKGREFYREYHEQDHEHSEEEEPEEIDLEDCPYCKWDEVCPGGCQTGAHHQWKYEKKEGES